MLLSDRSMIGSSELLRCCFSSGIILLLTKKYRTVALLLMLPVTYGIIAFHLAVDLEGIGPGLIVAIIHVYLLSTKMKTLTNLVTQ